MNFRYDWILFDADHTLFYFDRASEEALSEVLAEHGHPWSEGMYSDYKRINVQCWTEHEQGLIDRDTLVYERFRRYFDFRDLNLDPVSTQSQYLHRLSTKPFLMPGASDMLYELKHKVKLGYITNGMKEVQRPRLERIGFHQVFDVIIIAGEIGHSKPHRPYFEYTHNAIGNPAHDRVLVVGDSLTADINGGMQFGYKTCWFNPDDLPVPELPRPDFIIRDLSQLRDLI
jgi:YjjG family noncanonical pyrimidine nucleotidase